MSVKVNTRLTIRVLFQYLFFLILSSGALAQNYKKTDSLESSSKLFRSTEILHMKLSYSNRTMRYKTNDSTYLASNLSYLTTDGSWKILAVKLRARGNFRRKNCDNTPLKLKIKTKNSETTLFEGNKKLKLVLPCFNDSSSDDYIIKEYIAYKFYEKLSPYHFKTRLVSIEFEDTGRRKGPRKFLGFLIEDVKNVADRHNGNVFKRHMRPQTQDAITSVQNALFQFMISNTDFSTTYQHNQKQLWADKKIRPLPYDFDMSGFVDTNYAVVSKVQNRALPISEVTERWYKGFERETNVFETVRTHFITNKWLVLEILDNHRVFFRRNFEFTKAKDFIISFYKIIESDKKYKKNILDRARPIVPRKLKTK